VTVGKPEKAWSVVQTFHTLPIRSGPALRVVLLVPFHPLPESLDAGFDSRYGERRTLREDPLPCAEIKPAVGHRHHRCASRPITCNVQLVSAARFRCASAALALRSGQASSPVRLCNRPLAGVVIDERAGRNVLRTYKGQSPLCGIPLSYP
jgi:hypothetical protein